MTEEIKRLVELINVSIETAKKIRDENKDDNFEFTTTIRKLSRQRCNATVDAYENVLRIMKDLGIYDENRT